MIIGLCNSPRDEWGERASRDQGYSGDNFAQAVKQICGEQVRVEVIKRQSKEFEVLPKRWIVERTFGWLNRFRRRAQGLRVIYRV